MSPVDKASEKQKKENEREEDLRHEWVEDDIKSEKRKPNIEEIDEDPTAMGE